MCRWSLRRSLCKYDTLRLPLDSLEHSIITPHAGEDFQTRLEKSVSAWWTYPTYQTSAIVVEADV